MRTVLHILQDAPITDQIIENFNKADHDHVFLISWDGETEIKYTKSTNENIHVFNYYKADINEFIVKHSIVGVILHGLFHPSITIASKINAELKIGWFVWGADMYHLPKIATRLYAGKTQKIFLQTNLKLAISRSILQYNSLAIFIYKYLLKKKHPFSDQFAVIKKSDFFITYMKEDYNFFSRYYSNELEFIHANFNTIDQYLAGNNDLRINDDACNILIGNSNTFENNHIDVVNKLSKYKDFLDNTRFYFPLSYGGDSQYKEKVIAFSKNVFGQSVVPLLGFIERNEYLKILQSCSAAIFYTFRQQAMGNIIALLFMGARIYLSVKNPAFDYLKRIGVVVYSLETDFVKYGNSRLDLQTANHNRKLLNELFSENSVIKELKILSDKLRA